MRISLLFPAAALVAAAVAQSPDAIHYRLEIELLFATQTIQGTCTATFESRSPALDTVSLDLHSALAVTAVQMNGAPVAFTRPTHRIDITLDQPYGIGQQFTVTVAYGGSPPPPSGFGGLRFVTTAGNRPAAWTLSEPWDARTWWPGKDQLDDKATFEMWIVHPATMQAASNGLLEGVDPLPGNRVRSRWRTQYPMAAYLASFVVTEFSRRTDVYTGFGASMPVEFFVFPESFTSWQTGMDRVVPMLHAFSSAYGQYPFVAEKYGIAQFTWSGGMEHQTISSQSSIGESLTAHELAHQWWGDMITCRTWHDIWLNEGFATFSEALWQERKAGGTIQAYLAAMVARKPATTQGTVYVYNPSSTASIFNTSNVYRKGAWVLHMLRFVLGEAAFFQGLLDYRAAYEGDSATTAEFRGALEQSTGRQLGWFFDQWVMHPGSPAYVARWQSKVRGGQHYLYLQLDQTQTSQPVFTMPVPVRIVTSAGTVDAVVWNDERSDELVVPLPAPASSVAIDPDQWILRGTPQAGNYAPPFFGTDRHELEVLSGGAVEYHLDLGPAAAGRPYAVLIGISGSTPPLVLAGLAVPVAYDPITEVAFALANTPLFVDFLGTLDATGGTRARLVMPAGLASFLAGAALTGAALCVDSFDFASRPVTIQCR